MREKHLRERLRVATENGDDDEVEIRRIIKRESERRRQRRINKVIKPNQGRAVLKVQLNDPKLTEKSDAIYITSEEDIVRECNSKLGSRFQLGKRAPISQGQLKEDFGDLADTKSAEEVLKGVYKYPEGIDKATKLLLEEITRIASLFDKDETEHKEITLEEYISYWKKENEKKSSSHSGRHVGHYKAIVEDVDLAALHAASMNLAIRRGIPLSRWKTAVTTLLEKEAGNCYIEKLRAICLAEKDFNSILKIFYARRMVELLRKMDMIPTEQIATKGKRAIDGVMQKQFFYDQSNISHIDASLSSTDAANCYDAVNHPVCSLILQAIQVPMTAISTYLTSLQTMTFYLKTGFGMAKEGYGGTVDNPYMGLTQGSCASPPVWTAVSTVIVRAYKNEGHGVEFRTLWTGLMVAIVAILFVDDTDLLHRRRLRGETREEFIHRVCQATYLWAELLQATGGNLKPPKCYYYLMLYKFVSGRPMLMEKQECLSFEQIKIPQHEGPDVKIELKDVTEASETLGVFTNPESNSHKQMDSIMEKAYKWADKVGSSSLTPGECYYSFVTQALPQARYGLIPLLESPEVVEESYLKVYYNVLHKLGINRHIPVDFRWLPWQYQGLGLPNLGLEKASMMIQFVNTHWGQSTGMGIMMRSTYEMVQIETGLKGNFLTRDFTRLGCLATRTWFRHLWQYMHYYRINFEVGDVVIPVVRERDEPLMEKVVREVDKGFWLSVNRVQRFKRVYFISQLLCVDGKKVHPRMMDKTIGPESTIEFPHEQPSDKDFKIWYQVIRDITSASLEFSPPLGNYLREGLGKEQWFIHEGYPHNIFCHSQGTVQAYTHAVTPVRTRSSDQWQKVYTVDKIEARKTCRLSVKETSNETVRIIAKMTTRSRIPDDTPTNSPVDWLLSLENKTLWSHMDIEDGGEWITDALVDGSLVLVHDGSYMPNLSPSVCSTALVIFCKIRGKLGTISIAEKTDHHTASNYRGEALGGILGGALLWASTREDKDYTDTKINCDNLGVVTRINSRWTTWPEKQVHVDVLMCTTNILKTLPMIVTYDHIYGHQDDNVPFDDLPLTAQLNVIADQLAKQRLEEAVEENLFVSSKFPFEATRTFLGTKKVTSSVKGALYEAWGRRIAREVFVHKGIVKAKSFSTINWDAVGEASKTFPHGFRLWITKQVTHFAGHNQMMANFNPQHTDRCPCCGLEEETMDHISQCGDKGRTQMFMESVEDLVEYCESTGLDEELTEGIEAYLKLRGRSTLRDILTTNDGYLQEYALEHDNLGWSNFMEGRISTKLFEIQQNTLMENGSNVGIKSWSVKFLQLVLQITHRQWLYRNAKVHLKKLEGRSEKEHLQIIDEVKQMMLIDPSELLPRHQQLLLKDFKALGAGTTVGRIQWLNEMESALSAKKKVDDREVQRSNKRHSMAWSTNRRHESQSWVTNPSSHEDHGVLPPSPDGRKGMPPNARRR